MPVTQNNAENEEAEERLEEVQEEMSVIDDKTFGYYLWLTKIEDDDEEKTEELESKMRDLFDREEELDDEERELKKELGLFGRHERDRSGAFKTY